MVAFFIYRSLHQAIFGLRCSLARAAQAVHPPHPHPALRRPRSRAAAPQSFQPRTPASERNDVGEAHAQQHVGGQHRALAGTADDHDLLLAPAGQFRHGLVVVPFAGLFQHAARHVDRARDMQRREFRRFAHIEQEGLVARRKRRSSPTADLLHARERIGNQIIVALHSFPFCFSKIAIDSTCEVCGNMFMTPAAFRTYPCTCTSTAASRASVAGLQLT